MPRPGFAANRGQRPGVAWQGPISWIDYPLSTFATYCGFSADDPLASPLADGAAVASWRNGGSLGTAWDQSVAGSRGTFRKSLAAFAGFGAMTLDGTDDKLEILSGVSLATPWSAVVLGVCHTTAALQVLLGLHTGGTGRGLRVSSTNQLVYNNASGSLASAADVITDGVPFLAAAYVDGSSVTLSVNGSVVAGPTALAGATVDQVVIGAGRSSGTTYGNPWDGDANLAFVMSGNIFTDPSTPLLLDYARSRGVPL